MRNDTVWVLVAQQIWNSSETVIGAFTVEAELSEAAEAWRAQATVRSTDLLTAQKWQGALLLEQAAI
ncbi:hypothetical protein HQQ81_16535 [Microbacteriaceae bacterium VKM Ac-2854]|nr:hypothetical protein [Microbacteriaceae bacterium VKM Ac-2854]